MGAPSLPPAPETAQLTDGSGVLSPVWSGWFRQLFNRVGGSSGGLAITDGSITTPLLANGAVTTAKLASSAVTTSIIASGAVTQAKLGTINAPYVYNVKNYGATGNGSTDDTTAVQAAITAAGTGGVVYFPPGVYKITSTLTLGSYQKLKGDNYFLGVGGTAPTELYFALGSTGTGISAGTNCSFEDILLAGPNTGTAIGVVSASGAPRFRNVQFYYWYQAVSLSNAYYSQFHDCEFSYCKFGVSLTGCYNVDSYGNRFNSFWQYDSSLGSAWTVTDYVHNLKIFGGSIENFGSAGGISAAGDSGISVFGTYFEGHGSAGPFDGIGISVSGSTNCITVTGCMIYLTDIDRFLAASGAATTNITSTGNKFACGATSGNSIAYDLPSSGEHNIHGDDWNDANTYGTRVSTANPNRNAHWTGAPGTGTNVTAKALLLYEDSRVTHSNGWCTDGTILGLNAHSGFTGRLISCQTEGAELAYINYLGNAVFQNIEAFNFLYVGGMRVSGNGLAIMDIQGAYTASTSPLTHIRFNHTSITNSSGVDVGVVFAPLYSQTGTAGSTDCLINRTETSIGSGAHLFMDLQVGGTSLFQIDRTGVITLGGRQITGTRASPTLIAAAGTIAIGSGMSQTIRIAGNAAAVSATMAAGTVDGMEVTLQGCDSTNTVTVTGAGQNGDWIGQNRSMITLLWDNGATEWVEKSRNYV